MTGQPIETPFERQLQPGHFLHWQGQRYRLLPGDEVDPLTLHVENVATTEQHTLRMEELLLCNGADEAEPVFAPTLAALQHELERRSQNPVSIPIHPDGLPDHLLNRAEAMITVVETVDCLVAAEEGRGRSQPDGEKFKRTSAIQRACAQLDQPVKPATYYKYRRLYRQAGGNRNQIAAALRRSTFNQTRMNRTQLHFIDIHIMRFYARSRQFRPRPSTVYEIAKATLKRTNGLWVDPERCVGQTPENLIEELLNPKLPFAAISDNPEKAKLLKAIQLPSLSWFYQYLRWFEHQPEHGKAVMTARYGQDIWEREQMVFDVFVNRATLPLQYVFADHWLVDVFTVDEATRSQLDRLWLTLLIDAYSRNVLGLALLYETPGIESIQSALRHAIWPKTIPAEVETGAEWVCYGIPQQLSLDNAWAHHSHSLENLARVIGQNGRYNSIDLIFRPPYKGRYGALIERLFGNFSGQMKELLPGAIRSNQPKVLRQAATEACLLYQDLYRIIHEMIVTYQHTPHRELEGLTPHQKWLAGMQLGLPMVPPLTPAVERLFWRMSSETRVINHEGVSAFGLHYWSPELTGIERVGQDGRALPYNFSYEPADISRLALFRAGHWLMDVSAKELRLADGSSLPVSLWERKIARILARRDGKSSRDWLAYIHNIDELTKCRLAEKKKTRRHQAGQNAKVKPNPNIQATETTSKQNDLDDGRQTYTELLAKFVGHPNGQEVIS